MDPTLLLWTVLFLVLLAEFINGWTDAPNAIATIVVTGAMRIQHAIFGAVVMNALGTLCGTAVAATIGKGIVASGSITLPTIGAAMVSIIAWGSFAASRGWPVSKSHALLAGIAGAAIAKDGFGALTLAGWYKVLEGMGGSLIGGSIVAFVLGCALLEILIRVPPSPTKRIVDYGHGVTGMAMAFVHGMNDGQKFIGIFAMVYQVGHGSQEFVIHWWMTVACSLTMGAGTAFGGYRIINTVGKKLGDISSWQGLAATSSASLVILLASLKGIPLSTTHTITASIAGANSAKGFRSVRWHVMGSIMKAWLLTFPSCAFISFCAASAVLYGGKLFP
jgi:inorganic phosphate transporter, PiT family